ncbi:MAG: Omp28-related outer membrane protein [Bacteroidales bacterium]|nr:Omp28-related outer membrane protein [Bacteroidales bacterium]
MKKFAFALMALLAFSFSLKAQQFVSTEPANRNVIIEEFTGRNCQYCPDGHRIVNELMAAHPGRLWGINIHAGGYAPTSYPNMITQDGNTIHGGFSISGYPCGVVNRSTAAAQNRGEWNGTATQQLNQLSECNVAGQVVLNPTSRMAIITVEVYYTGNSSADENYLTVAMLQDSILGSQVGGSTWNPGQIINGQYVHTHVLRDIITENAWGEAISPTTQGTLITKTYTYEIPESIGNPNGVEVDLDNIHFLAWVSERYQGTPTRPILTGNQLDVIVGSDQPIFPFLKTVAQSSVTTCSHNEIINVNVQNGGTETLTSLTLTAEVDGETFTANWEGSIAQYGIGKVEIPVVMSFGTTTATVRITEANGQSFDAQSQCSITCLEWADLEIEGEEEELRLEIMQDKFGNQTTWTVTDSEGNLLGSGGPYDMLLGGTATQIHVEYVMVPVNECVKFTIHDDNGNGICCAYGQGYYIAKDSQGNVLFGDQNDGDFGEEVSHLISVRAAGASVSVGVTEVNNVDYAHADFAAPLEYDGYPDQVGFSVRKVTSPDPFIVPGFLNEFRNILGSTDDLEPASIYMVKAFAVVNGQTYYGTETTFQTMPEGVDELAATLKLYPNPTSNVLNIEGEGMSDVEVFNAVGQRMMIVNVEGDKAQVHIESLSNGLYFVRIHANDGTVLNRTFSVVR